MESAYDRRKAESSEELYDIDGELAEAKEKMQAVYESNREGMKLVLAAQREQQALYDDLKAKSDGFELEAAEALKKGDREGALSCIKEKQEIGPALIDMGRALSEANKAVETVTKVINEQREDIEKTTTLAIQYKTQMAASDIQNRIYEALQNLDFGMEFESFKAGKAIVDELEFENAARMEVQSGRLDLEIAMLEEDIANADADKELLKIENKIESGEIIPTSSLEREGFSPGFSAQSDEDFLRGLDETLEELNTDLPPSGES